MQSGWILLFDTFDKIVGPATRVALEVPGIMNSINKDKSVPKALLDNLVNHRINAKLSSLSKGSWITLTNNHIKDIEEVISFSENRVILWKRIT